MHDEMTGCGCGPTDCWSMPPEFVRVRYFFGQRLGVMELGDEAAYHAGKLAFHNARLHGVGVLCGLRVERFVYPQGAAVDTPTTVLRVSKGAALDACGREIIVGADQCIDIAAWFAKNKSRPELQGWTADTIQNLHVAVRYRECPTDPSPAPRDPCGCDNGGCEFGRVREGFELTLFTDSETHRCSHDLFPPADALRAALEGLTSPSSAAAPEQLAPTIANLVAGNCPAPVDEPWICLASFAVTLGVTPAVTLGVTPAPINISEPDNTIPERPSLLSTAALQAILSELAASGADAGLLGTGPRIAGSVDFTTSSSTFTIAVKLAKKSLPSTDEATIVKATFDAASVQVHKLDPGAPSGWTPITLVSATYADVNAAIEIQASGLSVGLFRIVVDQPFHTPTVDELGRPLRPLRFARLFGLKDAGGQLVPDNS